MIHELTGIEESTGRRVRARVEADSLEAAIERASRHGVRIDPQTPAPAASAGPEEGAVGSGPDAVGTDGAADTEPASAGAIVVHERAYPLSGSGVTPPKSERSVGSARWTTGRVVATAVVTAVVAILGTMALVRPSEPELTPEQLRHQEMNDATLAAWNHMVRLEQAHLAPLRSYDQTYASLVSRHYRTIELAGTDPDFKLVINDMIRAADELVEINTAWQREIASIEARRSTRASGAAGDLAVQLGAEAAASGESLKDSFLRGAAGAAAGALGGAVASNFSTNAERDRIDSMYRRQHQQASQTLAHQHRRSSALLRTLQDRYGWRDAD